MVGPEHSIAMKDMYRAWQYCCKEQGDLKPGPFNHFSAALSEVIRVAPEGAQPEAALCRRGAKRARREGSRRGRRSGECPAARWLVNMKTHACSRMSQHCFPGNAGPASRAVLIFRRSRCRSRENRRISHFLETRLPWRKCESCVTMRESDAIATHLHLYMNIVDKKEEDNLWASLTYS